MSFPNDENGDVLRLMLKNGDDLNIPREINFSVIFPTESAAIQFAVHSLKNELKVSFSSYESDDEMPWQVEIHIFMLPTHENITGFELLLAEQSNEYGGQNDGWGSLSQGKDS